MQRGERVNIHEYQAKEILRREGVPIPPGEVATTPDEVEPIARRFGGTVVVKAQVHAGGRGKAGGVKLAKTPAEATRVASKILGMQIKGLRSRRCSSPPAADIATEAYVGIIVDRASKKRGVHGEPRRRHRHRGSRRDRRPRRSSSCPSTRATACSRIEAMRLGFFLYDDVEEGARGRDDHAAALRAFMTSGASLAEINPLVTTPAGEVVALDAKMVIDDNELDRHPDIAALRDESAEAPSEVQARNANLTFIKLDGNVGCIVNGAGLAMATMDLVKYYGGEPANFLDIGGSSNPEKVVNALRIITADPNVKAILFNIFGGITRTDDVANGIVTATQQNPLNVPLVIRLTGTNEEIALAILAGARLLGDARHGRGGAESRRAREGRCRVSIFIDRSSTRARSGHHGPRRLVPRAADARVRHDDRRRRHAGQGRPEVRRRGADLRHGRRCRRADARQHVGDLRAAAVRRRRDDGGRGGRESTSSSASRKACRCST